MAPAAASAAATDVSTAVQPEALGAWLEAWAAEHGGVEATDVRPGRVTYTAADGARIQCDPPFPPLHGVGPRGHSAGLFSGARLVDSAVAGRPRHDAESAAAGLAAKVLLPHRDDLEAIVLAGERRALGVVIEDPRLRGLARLAGEEIIDVGDHRLQNLRRLPERFRATVIRP